MTIAHTIEIMTLINATTLIAHNQAGNHEPSQVETGVAQVGYGNSPFADAKPLIRKMHSPIERITSSTK